ncbi:MAG: DUF6387 family protein [Thiobacillus sp.]
MENILEWFVLGNYKKAATFTARHWHNEIQNRVGFFNMLYDPSSVVPWMAPLSPEVERFYKKSALEFFSKVKKFGLTSNFPRPELAITTSPLDQYFELLDSNGYVRSKYQSIKPFSVQNAFELVNKTENHVEIMQEMDLEKQLDFFEDMEQRAKIYAKYSRPLAELGAWREHHERFISVSLHATDEQLFKEFQLWLTEEREKSPRTVSAKMFTESDFQDWHLAKIIPYFDLRTIAKIEGVRAPNHLIADLIFPNEIGVDVSERVRKVTKIKAERVFSQEVVGALLEQAEMESKTGKK